MRAVSLSSQPQCVWLSPDRQGLEQDRNVPTAAFPGLTCLTAQHAVMQTTTNRINCKGFRKATSRLHACAIAHASFFLPLLERNTHSTSLIATYFDKSRCGHVYCKMWSRSDVWVLSKVHPHRHCQNPANSQVRGFYWYLVWSDHRQMTRCVADR